MKSIEDKERKLWEILTWKVLNHILQKASTKVQEHLATAKVVAEARSLWDGIQILHALLLAGNHENGEDIVVDPQIGLTFRLSKTTNTIGLRVTKNGAAVQVRYNGQTQSTFVSGEGGELGEFMRIELDKLV